LAPGLAILEQGWSRTVPFGYDSGFDVATLETLTSAGVTSAQKTAGADLTFQVTVSSIGTNVVIRLEGSLDDVSYFNLDSANADTTITSDGTYGFSLNGCPVQYARLRLVSVSGGAPSVATSLGAM
jgi:hypothetical protein